ncbi:hypothetical protein [Fimbriimonas ginsengisoli]|uniref:hypothetical protein n=1 Tax=Fimbriimonas ginsengisoli TaxID=1005039 RepID=UPI0011869DA6|nr:hypothetical protein [Fimbriimonas ginsengisoli]
MRRYLSCLTLLALAGCGGGGSSSPSFNIVGRWHLDSIQDKSGSGACAVTLPSGRGCAADTVFTFLADGAYGVEGGVQTWRIEGNNLIVFDSDSRTTITYSMTHTNGDAMILTNLPDSPDYIKSSFHRLR